MINKEFLKFMLENFDKVDVDKQPLLVRTDIMSPEVYFYMEYKYKNIVSMIARCGGYCFYQHFYLMYGNKVTALDAIKHLEDLNVIGTEYLNNNKYLYLKHIALKYLKFKDELKIYTEGRPELSNRSHILNKPADSVLKRSAAVMEYNFDYIERSQEDESFNKNKSYEVFLSKEMGSYFLNVFYGKRNDFNLEKATEDFRFLYERSFIYLACILCEGFFIDDPETEIIDEDVIFHFTMFDFGETNEKSIYSALVKLSNYLSEFGYIDLLGKDVPDFIKMQARDVKPIKKNCYKFKLEICTLNEHREEVLKKMVESVWDNVQVKNKYILDAQKDNKLLRAKSNEELFEKREQLKELYVSGLKEIVVNQKIQGVESFFKNSSQKVKTFVKNKDIDRFQQLRQYLSENK